MKYLDPDGNHLLQTLQHVGFHWSWSLVKMKMMQIICYGLHNTQLTTQLKTYGRFYYQQRITWGNNFLYTGVRYTSIVPEMNRIDSKDYLKIFLLFRSK